MENQRQKAIDSALSSIERQYGEGSIMRMGNNAKQSCFQDNVLPTGCLGIDLALGIGGLPKGRVIEIFGPESSGKTTLTLQLIAQCQRAGQVAAFIDAEHALDISYAKALGVVAEDLLVSQPDCAEQALEITDILVRSGAVGLIVVDSVAALVPKAEVDGEMGDTHMGLQARLMSQALRKLTGNLSRNQATLVFINQIRMKIGVTFGNPETTTGGTALKFFSSVRLEIRKAGTIKDGNQIVGNRTRLKVVKNKLAPPFREVEFDILYGTGICPFGDLIDQGLARQVIQKNGTWLSFDGTRLGQGRENARETLRTRPDLAQTLRDSILRLPHQEWSQVGESQLEAA